MFFSFFLGAVGTQIRSTNSRIGYQKLLTSYELVCVECGKIVILERTISISTSGQFCTN
jgi:hypothetical protein